METNNAWGMVTFFGTLSVVAAYFYILILMRRENQRYQANTIERAESDRVTLETQHEQLVEQARQIEEAKELQRMALQIQERDDARRN